MSFEARLTRREIEIFRRLLELQTNKEIAEALGVSERTAKYHVSGILAKARRIEGPEAGANRLALYKHFARQYNLPGKDL